MLRLKTDVVVDDEYINQPLFALVFHSLKRPYHIQSNTVVCVTRHEVIGHRIGPGVNLDLGAARELLESLAFEQMETTRQLLPANLLAEASGFLLWWTPAQRRPMWIMRNTQLVRLLVPWPSLLFRVSIQGLHVAALAGCERPQEETPLYHAPLMNIYASGSLCFGNIAKPAVSLNALDEWEATIFDTRFTHTNHEQVLLWQKPPKDSTSALFRLWRKLDRESAVHFPEHRLAPMNRSVGDWLHAG